MCCSIILVFLALGSPEPLQAQENQKERITIQVKNQPIQKVFDDLSKQTGLKFFYGEAIANRNVQVNLKFKNAPVNSVLNEITRQANSRQSRKRGQRLRSGDARPKSDRYHYR